PRRRSPGARNPPQPPGSAGRDRAAAGLAQGQQPRNPPSGGTAGGDRPPPGVRVATPSPAAAPARAAATTGNPALSPLPRPPDRSCQPFPGGGGPEKRRAPGTAAGVPEVQALEQRLQG
ncbi:MAG: hypothetical protein ACK56I_30810, partial [bacterium]